MVSFFQTIVFEEIVVIFEILYRSDYFINFVTLHFI